MDIEGVDDTLSIVVIMNRQGERVPRGTGTPKDTDEINRREVYECDG